MRIEGDFIKINEWLRPLSWIYGLGVGFRNMLFEIGVLKSRAYDIPVIAVGNITVGGSGKTPHVEYLINLLHDKLKVAVLSRGYKRKSRGYVLAGEDTPMRMIGDEPFQMKSKYGDIYVAVDKNRREGISRLTHDEETSDTDVILLDDAFQHRYVKPGINILLVDYHRLIIYDELLPAGHLRESKDGKRRADMVIITKCPKDLKPMEFRVLTRAMDLYPYQDLFFTTLNYKKPKGIFSDKEMALTDISKDTSIMLLTGIASPQQMIVDLKPYGKQIVPLSFADHHNFSASDIEKINSKFAALPSPRIIITTEKDRSRLLTADGLSEEVKGSIYALPIEVKFMLDGEKTFDEKIISYVRKNSRNSILAKRKEEKEKEKNRNK